MSVAIGKFVSDALKYASNDWRQKSGDQIREDLSSAAIGFAGYGDHRDAVLEFMDKYEAHGGTGQEAVARLVEIAQDPEHADKPLLVNGQLNPQIAHLAVPEPKAPEVDGPEADTSTHDDWEGDIRDVEPVPMPEIGGESGWSVVEPVPMPEVGANPKGWGAELYENGVTPMPWYTNELPPWLNELPEIGEGGVLASLPPEVADILSEFIPPEIMNQIAEVLDLIGSDVLTAGNGGHATSYTW